MTTYHTNNLIELTSYHSPDGQIFRFDSTDRFLISEAGNGMPPIKYIEARGPFQHGKTLYDYRLDARTIQIVFRENACSRSAYWANRANVLNILRPNRQLVDTFALGHLLKVLPDGSQRQIDVIIDAGPDFRAREPGKWDEWSVHESLKFIAPDPTFYDPTQIVNTVYHSSHALFHAWTINYTGTWLSYPYIVLLGPLEDPILTNVTTGEKIDLTGYHIAAGETVTLDLQFGYKQITSSVSGNIMAYVSSDSDIATFHLAADPEAAGGVNSFTLTENGGATNATYRSIQYYTRYIGI